MTPARLAEAREAAEFAAELRRTIAGQPRVWERPLAETRRAGREGAGPFGPVTLSANAIWREIAGRDGPIRLRVLTPRSGAVDRTYLRIHGGGWALGAAEGGEPYLDELAQATSAVIVSVEYRLAPEHAFPAGLDDCVDAAEWLIANSRHEFGVDCRVIGGDSAGAHLSVLTLLQLRDAAGVTGFAAANLLYGCYDLGGTPSLLNWGDDNLILDTSTMLWFRDQLLQGRYDPSAPAVSPVYADLRGLPPALFIIGSLDPLLDDSLLLADLWRAAGNDADLVVFAGGVHAFDAFEIGIAKRARARVAEFLLSASAPEHSLCA